jgi:formylmethanofuran dehydrogenase subunit E/predicted RNA-binding protein
MCESNVYIERNGREELLMEDVARLWPEAGEMVLEGILGEQRRVHAGLKWIDLEGHRVLLEPGGPRELAQAKAFHGHLGPNLVLGLRMGQIIVDRFGAEPFTYTVTAYTGRTPPISCIIDGLQLATPCSVGSGTVQIAEGGEARVVAEREGNCLEIRVHQGILDRIEAEYDPKHEEALPLEFWGMPDEELFEVEEA